MDLHEAHTTSFELMPESPLSNPLAPPSSRPPGGGSKPLSNADFRKIMMTPRATPVGRSGGGGGGRGGRGGNIGRGGDRGGDGDDSPPPIVDDDPDRPISNPIRPVKNNKPKDDTEDVAARQKAKKWGGNKKEKEAAAAAARYRDRAKERREGANPDYEESEVQLSTGFHAVPPPDPEGNNPDLMKMSIEQSKFLGGDMDHTHLVKGLDFALLNKVKSENVQKEKEDRDKALQEIEEQQTKQKQQQQPQNGLPPMRPPTLSSALGVKKAEALAAPAIPTSTPLGRSILHIVTKPVVKNEHFLPGRMAFVYDMEDEFPQELPTTLLRSKEDCPKDIQSLNAKLDPLLIEKIAKVMSFLHHGGASNQKKLKKKTKEEGEKEKEHEEKKPVVPVVKHEPVRMDEDDIFSDVGIDYVVTKKVKDEDEEMKPSHQDSKKETSKDTKEDSKRDEKKADKKDDKAKYFHSSAEEPEVKAADNAQEVIKQAKLLASMNPVALKEAKEKEKMEKEKEKWKGKPAETGDKPANKKAKMPQDPGYEEDSYAECYPGAYETTVYAYESDDEEEDITKMDMGSSKKGKLKRYDFEDEESWNAYNDQREAMPKAAFQFGVKMSDGRKTRRNTKESKLNADVKKINEILKQRAVDSVKAKKNPGEAPDDKRGHKKSRIDDF